MMITGAAGGDTKLSWISVFNGEDLSGWTVPGKATWSVQKGVLVHCNIDNGYATDTIGPWLPND